ncbi:hypothetical protein BaRGS_00031929 [Batillaria attramentaria]|uniref:Uncharacterized protein n=1 Tax=Batillaria attramentaria TaxID=370345 RepID=A0ABD0JPS0_9CAEN
MNQRHTECRLCFNICFSDGVKPVYTTTSEAQPLTTTTAVTTLVQELSGPCFLERVRTLGPENQRRQRSDVEGSHPETAYTGHSLLTINTPGKREHAIKRLTRSRCKQYVIRHFLKTTTNITGDEGLAPPNSETEQTPNVEPVPHQIKNEGVGTKLPKSGFSEEHRAYTKSTGVREKEKHPATEDSFTQLINELEEGRDTHTEDKTT